MEAQADRFHYPVHGGYRQGDQRHENRHQRKGENNRAAVHATVCSVKCSENSTAQSQSVVSLGFDIISLLDSRRVLNWVTVMFSNSELYPLVPLKPPIKTELCLAVMFAIYFIPMVREGKLQASDVVPSGYQEVMELNYVPYN